MTFTILFLSEMYGLVTVGQVKDGKHLYRALEGHFPLSLSLSLSLYKMYVGMFIDRHQVIEKVIKEVIVNSILDISEYSNEQEEKIKQNHENVRHLMEEINSQNYKVNLIRVYQIKEGFMAIMWIFLKSFCFSSGHQENSHGNFIYKVQIYFAHTSLLLIC